MLDISFTIESDRTTKRGHNRVMKEVNRGVLLRHLRLDVPKHFTLRAKSEYGYKPRTKGYLIKKARILGHQIPLVLSGRLRATIRHNARITATAKGGRLRMRGYFPMPERMQSEIRAITNSETTDLVRWAAQRYVRLANRPENRRKRKRKTSSTNAGLRIV